MRREACLQRRTETPSNEPHLWDICVTRQYQSLKIGNAMFARSSRLKLQSSRRSYKTLSPKIASVHSVNEYVKGFSFKMMVELYVNKYNQITMLR